MMTKCPFCGANFVANTIFCGECGHYLLKDNDRATDPLEEIKAKTLADTAQLTASPPASLVANEPRAVRLIIGERQREVEIQLDSVTRLGRVDPGSDVFPELDLTEHGPAQNISRRHASIRKVDNQVVLEDLGSINGTFLNGKRLEAYMPYPLKTGDSFHLGNLRLKIEILLD
jgi:pSer/pThr/pTyr-binding forkhead associated (FHA) protein